MGVQAGMDSAILNPNDRNLRAMMLASEMPMGKDRFCQSFTRSVRGGKIGGTPKES